MNVMEVTKENIDTLNAEVKVHLKPEDYQEKVDKILKDYRKKANMQGFRPGQVPIGLIRKMYGKAVLVDEINKILNECVYKYVSENHINILGTPLPKENGEKSIDWDNDKEFEFTYQLGLSPGFEVKYENEKIDKYNIGIDDTLVNKYVEYVRKRYGKGESAELNQEIFDIVYGKDKVKSEEEFRSKVREEVVNLMKTESGRKLENDIIEKLIGKAKIKLPDEFLKKWLVLASEKPTTEEEVNKDYETYSKSLRWQLIENKLIKTADIKVTEEDVREEAKRFIRQQYAMYGQPDVDSASVEKSAEHIISSEKECRKIRDQLYNVKIMNLLKAAFTIKEKEVTYDEFVKLATEKPVESGFNKFFKTGFWKK